MSMASPGDQVDQNHPIKQGEMFIRALREAQVYKHSKQWAAKKELGDAPVEEWFRLYWPAWYRDRWVEHLTGKRMWKEFGEDDFNLVADKDFAPDSDLAVRIIGNLVKHRDNISENLGLILWASGHGESMDNVLQILRRLDINGHRCSCNTDKIRIFYKGLEEADKYKYIQSQKAKRDLGESAISEWFEKFWPGFANIHGIPPDESGCFVSS
jgi:hypothetical protein